MTLRSLAVAALCHAGAAALCFAAGAWVGQEWADRATAAAHGVELRRITDLYLQAVHAGNAQADELRAELTESQSFAIDLAQRSRDVPLVRPCRPSATPGPTHRSPAVAVAPVPGPVERAPDCAAELAALPASAVAPDAAAPAGGLAGDAGADELHLAAGAVSLWNSALAGTFVPTGACSLADPTSPACAADAGLTLRDAWDNQAANAAACRDNSTQLAALIAYLRQRQHTWSAAPADALTRPSD
jgi:hypothetical protein